MLIGKDNLNPLFKKLIDWDIKFNYKITPVLIMLVPGNFIFYVERKNTLSKFNL